MPPNIHSVMWLIPILLRSAITACPISCSRIDAKKSSELITART